MVALEYRHNLDYKHLKSWLLQRHLPEWEAASIPRLGVVVTPSVELIEPVAIGFLRMVEGQSAMLDGLISNPAAPAPSRDKAVQKAVECLISRAKDLGLTSLVAFTSDRNTLHRSNLVGFKKHFDQMVITLDLRKQ